MSLEGNQPEPQRDPSPALPAVLTQHLQPFKTVLSAYRKQNECHRNRPGCRNRSMRKAKVLGHQNPGRALLAAPVESEEHSSAVCSSVSSRLWRGCLSGYTNCHLLCPRTWSTPVGRRFSLAANSSCALMSEENRWSCRTAGRKVLLSINSTGTSRR